MKPRFIKSGFLHVALSFYNVVYCTIFYFQFQVVVNFISPLFLSDCSTGSCPGWPTCQFALSYFTDRTKKPNTSFSPFSMILIHRKRYGVNIEADKLASSRTNEAEDVSACRSYILVLCYTNKINSKRCCSISFVES